MANDISRSKCKVVSLEEAVDLTLITYTARDNRGNRFQSLPGVAEQRKDQQELESLAQQVKAPAAKALQLRRS